MSMSWQVRMMARASPGLDLGSGRGLASMPASAAATDGTGLCRVPSDTTGSRKVAEEGEVEVLST
jgi:hypothetical protein